MRRFLPALLLILVAALLLADAAGACAVCAVGEDPRSRDTYVIMTVVMTALPISIVGGLVWYVRHRVRAQQRLEARSH